MPLPTEKMTMGLGLGLKGTTMTTCGFFMEPGKPQNQVSHLIGKDGILW
jgi:hypothetical protein